MWLFHTGTRCTMVWHAYPGMYWYVLVCIPLYVLVYLFRQHSVHARRCTEVWLRAKKRHERENITVGKKGITRARSVATSKNKHEDVDERARHKSLTCRAIGTPTAALPLAPGLRTQHTGTTPGARSVPSPRLAPSEKKAKKRGREPRGGLPISCMAVAAQGGEKKNMRRALNTYPTSHVPFTRALVCALRFGFARARPASHLIHKALR